MYSFDKFIWLCLGMFMKDYLGFIASTQGLDQNYRFIRVPISEGSLLFVMTTCRHVFEAVNCSKIHLLFLLRV